MSVSQSPGGTSGGLQGVQTISTRARKISKSKNDLDQIPIATPLLGETQGQISNTKNIQRSVFYSLSTLPLLGCPRERFLAITSGSVPDRF